MERAISLDNQTSSSTAPGEPGGAILPQNKSIKLALAAGNHWREPCTGVNTFFRAAFDEWAHSYDCVFDGNPYRRQVLPSLRKKATAAPSAGGRGRSASPSSLRLFLGYLKLLFAQVGHVWKVRKGLRGRVIVLNEFGCEVMPIAYRICLPKAVILAIVHTHPGQDVASENWVRCLVEKLGYRSVSDLVFNSNSTKELWRRKLGLDQIRGRAIWYGIDECSPDLPSDYPAKQDGGVDFIYLAQFYGWKGQLGLLRIWKTVVKQVRKGVRLIMIGDGVGLSACREYVADNDLSDSVVFLGQKANGSAYLNGGDVLVHLPHEPEAFGLVLVEAMRAALPVVASRLGGIPEIVEHETTGFLVDPKDEEQVAHAITRMSDDQRCREKLGRCGQARWLSEFTRKHMLDRYDHLFSELTPSQDAGT